MASNAPDPLAETGLWIGDRGQDSSLPESFRTGDGSLVTIGKFLGGTGKTCVHLVSHEGYAVPLVGKFARGTIDEEMKERMGNEAEFLAAVQNDSVPMPRGWGDIDGLPYILMDYHPGHSLQDRIDAADGIPFSLSCVKRMGLGIARSLADVHRAGIVHRDVKPGNILVADNGKVFLLDFGLACRRKEDIQRITQDNVSMGTPKYLDPDSRDSRHATTAVDIYGLGITLLELAIGRYPCADEDIQAVWIGQGDGQRLRDACEEHVLELSRKDKKIAELIRSMLGKPDARPTASKVAEQLRPNRKFLHSALVITPIAAAVALTLIGLFRKESDSDSLGSAPAVAQRAMTGKRDVGPTMPVAQVPEIDPFSLIGKSPSDGVSFSDLKGEKCAWVFRLSEEKIKSFGIENPPKRGAMCTVFSHRGQSLLFIPPDIKIPLSKMNEEQVEDFIRTFPDVDGEISLPDGFPGTQKSWRSTVNGRLRVLRETAGAHQ